MDHAHPVIAAFSEEQASRLTGVSIAQLRYWDRIRFYSPSYGEETRRAAFSRVYSFKDIVALRVLNALRNVYSVSLSHLRKVSARLRASGIESWTDVKLWALNKRVIWQEPGTGRPIEVLGVQYVMPVVLDVMISDAQRDIVELNKRDAALEGKIEKSRNVSHNAAVIAGTRIPVNAIKRFAEAGYEVAAILKEYPDLTEKDVVAALAYQTRAAA